VAPAARPTAANVSGWPTVAIASGVAVVGGIPLGAWQLAAFRVSEGLEAQLGRFPFDMGNLAVSALTSAE
jgi:hypothetical protein